MTIGKKQRPATYELISMLNAFKTMDQLHLPIDLDLMNQIATAIHERAEQYDYTTAPIGQLRDQ